MWPPDLKQDSRHAGFVNVKNAFEVVPEEARFVRLIFAWVGLERLSLREVCRRLQQAECRTRSGSARWWASTIHGMVENPAYTGTVKLSSKGTEKRRGSLELQTYAA